MDFGTDVDNNLSGCGSGTDVSKKLLSDCLLHEHWCSESHTLFRDVNKRLLLKITHLFSNFDESRLKISARMVVKRRLAKSGATKFVLLIWA